ncbi:hypothetical protein REPUB_Repub07fG0173000 [Reevesia pubescens]
MSFTFNIFSHGWEGDQNQGRDESTDALEPPRHSVWWPNLSLSLEDSWLPIASIIFCIVHVQLEASINNGDLQGFQIFSQAAKHISSRSGDEDTHFKGHKEPEVKKREYMNMLDAEEESRNEIWR